MDKPGLATQRQLAEWANFVTARTELPRLIRRLILETAPGVIQLGFPAGEGASARSWDGSVRATESMAYVPRGLSLWELSVHKSVGTKADSDYAKRLTTPDGSPTREATYVAGSLRRWGNRVDWARDRSADTRWSAVRAYGLDDIEAWLEVAPVTHAWISEVLGLHPYGIRSAEYWWDTWAAQTSPALTAELVLSGRGKAVESLRTRLEGASQVTTIKGPSLEEVLAFLAAAAVEADTTGGSQLLARMALVDDPAAWRALIAQPSPLVLVPTIESLKAEIPSGTPHHFLLPVIGTASADIQLPPIDAEGAAKALHEAGLVEDRRAEQGGHLARRSLIALRRNLAKKPELHVPRWATPPVPRTNRGILLAGRWSERLDGDKAVLASLTGDTYETLAEHLPALAATDDPFIAFVDSAWGIVSPFDAWLVLASQVREDDLKRLETAVREVIGEVDPALDLAPDDRWKADLEGKRRSYSHDLRRGLAETLALLGVHGEQVELAGGGTGVNWASYLVRDLLETANKDKTGRLWSSLAELLPLLAEASPDKVLDGVRAGASGDDPVLAKMFADRGADGLFSANSPHTGLLWALEVAAWSPEHFGQAVDLLARLAEVDPGGRLSNRPARSLASIFCPWHPENAVDADRRLNVLDSIRKRHQETAWPLMISMLPEFHGVHMPTSEPTFRDWKPPPVPVMTAEYLRFVAAVVTRVLEDVGSRPERWDDLLDRYPQLPPDDRRRVVEALATLAEQGSVDPKDTDGVWRGIRELVGKHTEFADADWALPAEEVTRLKDLSDKIQPASAYSRHAWLFTEHRPHLGTPERRDDYAAFEAELEAARRDAVKEIDVEGGLDLVLRLAHESALPWVVGVALADAFEGKYEDALLPLLGSDDQAEATVAHAYLGRRFHAAGWPWLEEFTGPQAGLSDDQQARLLVATHDFPRAWEVADAKGIGVANRFWELFRPVGLGQDFKHVRLVADRLLAVGRNAAALDFIGLYRERVQGSGEEFAELVAEGLTRLLDQQTADHEFRQLSGWDFEQLFAFMEANREAVGETRLAGLEWAYLQALGLHPDVPTLHMRMANDPAFFVQIVSTVFRPASGKEDSKPVDEARRRRAANGWDLLRSWNRPPGMVDSGQMDGSALRAWVTEARRLLKESDRLEVGESQIGQALVATPADPDGSWPGEVVRDLLEEIQSEHLESGLSTAVLNGRGITTRGLGEGGAQEMELAGSYRDQADRLADKWPRSAAMLRGLATSYESDARREEKRAERFRRGEL
jgi:hypothetical protein